MKKAHIHLQYRFDTTDQAGAEIENSLFDLLSALLEHGSIRHAAKAMECSYRHVWGALKQWEEQLGTPLVHWVQGKRAQLTPFAQRMMWAERQARTRMRPHLEALRVELQHVLVQARDAESEVLEVFASHDLGLPLLQALAAREQQLHLSLRFAGSEESLRSLLDGRCTVAGFHVPRLPKGSPVFAKALRPLLQPGVHKLIGSHWRRQGLMKRRLEPGATSIVDLAERARRFVSREPGSGTRLLMDHLVQQAGIAPEQIDGYFSRVEQTHVAVAAAVASGAADAGLGIEAAAREFGLDFVPLVEEDYFLVCLKTTLESNAVRRLRNVLMSSRWAKALLSLPGYGVARPGEVLSLTRALPWWRFAYAKGSAAALSDSD